MIVFSSCLLEANGMLYVNWHMSHHREYSVLTMHQMLFPPNSKRLEFLTARYATVQARALDRIVHESL